MPAVRGLRDRRHSGNLAETRRDVVAPYRNALRRNLGPDDRNVQENEKFLELQANLLRDRRAATLEANRNLTTKTDELVAALWPKLDAITGTAEADLVKKRELVKEATKDLEAAREDNRKSLKEKVKSLSEAFRDEVKKLREALKKENPDLENKIKGIMDKIRRALGIPQPQD